MGDPGAITCTQDRFESCDQTTRWHDRFYRTALPHMHVRLPVRNDEQAPCSQACPDLRCKPLPRPLRLSRHTQTRFSFCSRAGCVQALCKSRNFFGQRAKQFNIRNSDPGRWHASGSQGTHPVSRPGNWALAAPAHDQQCDQGNQHHVGQAAEESLTPDADTLGAYVFGVVHHCECSQKLIR